MRLRVGTLYGVLDRLVADGLAERDREEVHQGRLRGATGEAFTDVLNIGIGGSDLGPAMAARALWTPGAPMRAPRLCTGGPMFLLATALPASPCSRCRITALIVCRDRQPPALRRSRRRAALACGR